MPKKRKVSKKKKEISVIEENPFDASDNLMDEMEKEASIPLFKLSEDLIGAIKILGKKDIRFIVDLYYQVQEFRKRVKNQIRSAEDEPNAFLKFISRDMNRWEATIKKAMDHYSDISIVGRWAKSNYGIGPVLSAGLLAHIDMTKATTFAKLMRFGGIDPTNEWLGAEKARELVEKMKTEHNTEDPEELLHLISGKLNRNSETIRKMALWSPKGEKETLTMTNLISGLAKRPWNADLKTLIWKISDCFVKFSPNPDCFYGKLYIERKAWEIEKNNNGGNREYARDILLKKNFRKTTEAYKAYSNGKLPDLHVTNRAKRWTSKLFLSHWWTVAYEEHYKAQPPNPWVIEFGGHNDVIPPPNWPMAN